MAICVLCQDTGKVAGSFCVCTIGQLQRRVAKGAAKAEEMKEREQKERRARIKKTEQVEQLELIQEEPKGERNTIELYDWVEIIVPGPHKGVICLVTDIQKDRKRINLKGKGVEGWGNYNNVKLAQLSKKDEKDIHSLLELAVFTKDEDWFNALHQDLAAIKGRIDFKA